jgi:membrane protease YdiL (CAAX protease family)
LTLIETIARKLINIFFATALFEELFFRGLLQHYLTRKIATDIRWQSYWQWGFVLFLVVSGVVGYFLKPKGFWLPMLTTALLFAPAWFLEKKKVATQGTYTALAIISIFFGLVHAHSGSLPFVVLASIAGWAYGYVYLKTKNVFYAALVHTLVNGSEFIFGLELIK